MARRVENLAEWGRRITGGLRSEALDSPDPRLDGLIAELDGQLSVVSPSASHLGFAVPLRVRVPEGGVAPHQHSHLVRHHR
ncbi:hypothetical protein [Spirillospora sp. NPDC048819]|uniref:hypothetical protein n=1 Tax=Spirillospora sp. NPDC048819 TaxID=3155268 RepID=UPI0033DA6635